jgi:hypothetical protein
VPGISAAEPIGPSETRDESGYFVPYAVRNNDAEVGAVERAVALRVRVVKPLKGLRVAPYYGCLLLRPYDEIHLDDPEAPSILHDLVRALGAAVHPLGTGLMALAWHAILSRNPGGGIRTPPSPRTGSTSTAAVCSLEEIRRLFEELYEAEREFIRAF